MARDLRTAALHLADRNPKLRPHLLSVLKLARRDRYAAANTLTIAEDFLEKHWPAIKAAIKDKNWDKARTQVEIIQSAYYYAPGMNEHVVRLSDVEASWKITQLLQALKGGDEAQIQDALERADKQAVPEWKNILKNYKWQSGLRAEQIMAEAKALLNDAASRGNRIYKPVSDAFYTKGPEAARKVFEKLTAPKR